jgi:hypothetical protein
VFQLGTGQYWDSVKVVISIEDIPTRELKGAGPAIRTTARLPHVSRVFETWEARLTLLGEGTGKGMASAVPPIANHDAGFSP